MSYGVVIPARNEEKTISNVLQSILAQTIKPNVIVVINDGSTDNTEDIVKSFKIIKLLNKTDRGYTAVDRPEIALTFNLGFKYLKQFNLEHIFISGADCIYPTNYLETLINEMEKNKRLFLTSGQLISEPIDKVRGGGRLIRNSFFQRFMNGFYSHGYCWEGSPYYYAETLGLDFYPIKGLFFTTYRATETTYTVKHLTGRVFREVGVGMIWTWKSALSLFLRFKIKPAIQLLSYYYSTPIYTLPKDTRNKIHYLRIQHLWRKFIK